MPLVVLVITCLATHSTCLTTRNTRTTRSSAGSTGFSTPSTRFSTRSTCLSIRSTHLSTRSTRLSTLSICLPTCITRSKSLCSDLNFRYRACFEQGFPWHSGNYRVLIHSETRTWHARTCSHWMCCLCTQIKQSNSSSLSVSWMWNLTN